MNRIENSQSMIKEASDSGIIQKHADLETYRKIWNCFERILDIIEKPIDKES